MIGKTTEKDSPQRQQNSENPEIGTIDVDSFVLLGRAQREDVYRALSETEQQELTRTVIELAFKRNPTEARAVTSEFFFRNIGSPAS